MKKKIFGRVTTAQKKNLFTDPGIRRATSRVTPFILRGCVTEESGFKICSHDPTGNFGTIDSEIRNVFNAPFQSVNGDFGLIRFIGFSELKNQEENVNAINENISELHYFSGYIYESLISILSKENIEGRLSGREKDTLYWTAMGKNPAHIADELLISENTVCKHLSNIRCKLGVRTTTHAVVKAISEKLIHC